MRIQLADVHVTYHVGLELTAKDAVLGMLGVRKHPARTVEALRGVSLDIAAGERVGLIGRNGAGKSTLLRVMSGVWPPTRGTVDVAGRISCLFDLTQGFHEDATGHENIVTRSLVLGATREQVRRTHEWIVDFCELGDFLDMPIRTYSSGMRMRLAFAISTAYDTELLLLDEVVAAGDEHFRRKAIARIQHLVEQSAILVLVSHSPPILRQLCDRAVWLAGGRVREDGPADDVLTAYSGAFS